MQELVQLSALEIREGITYYQEQENHNVGDLVDEGTLH